MAAVGEHGVGPAEERAARVGIHVGGEAHDVRLAHLRERVDQARGPRCPDGPLDHLQPARPGRGQHLGAVGLGATSRHQQRPRALALELGDDLHALEPALVRVPARHLGQERAVAKRPTQRLDPRGIGPLEGVAAEAVGHDQGLCPEGPHAQLHVAAHGGDASDATELGKRHVVEAEDVVRVPQQRHAIAQARVDQEPVEREHRCSRLPFLGQNHRTPTGLQVGSQDATQEIRGKRGGVLGLLALLARVDSLRVMRAHPLAPAAQVQTAPELVSRKLGRADEPQVGLQAGIRQRLGEPAHARGETAGSGVPIGALEGEDVELHGGTLLPTRKARGTDRPIENAQGPCRGSRRAAPRAGMITAR